MLTQKTIVTLAHIESQAYIATLLFAAVYSFRNLLDQVWSGFNHFRLQSFVRLAEGIVTGLVFATMVMLQSTRLTATSYLLAVGLGTMTFTVVSIFLLAPRYFSALDVSRSLFVSMWKYARVSFFGPFSGMLISLDKVIINVYLGTTAVGIYSAYNYLFVSSIAQLGNMFSNVFFPTAAQSKNVHGIFDKLNRLTAVVSIPVVIAMSIFGWIALRFYGSQYPLVPGLVVGMAAYGVGKLMWTNYWTLIISEGVKGILYKHFYGISASLVYAGITWLLVPQLGLYAPIAAMAGALVIAGYSIIKWQLHRQSNPK